MSQVEAPNKPIVNDRSGATAEKMSQIWKHNAEENAGRVFHQVQDLWKDGSYKTGVLISAGPSLKESIKELKALNREDHEIVAVDMALKFLVENGIYPDYVITSDASTDIQNTLDVDLPGAGLALLMNVVASPATARNWKGPIYWFCMLSQYEDDGKTGWMQFAHQAASKVTSFLVPGGNVSSLGVSFLNGVRSCREIKLYGHDFCWSVDEEFYAGGVQREMAHERIRSERDAGTVFVVKDTNGRDVFTNGSMLGFASWYTDVSRAMPGLLVNRTPNTILG